MPVARSIYNAAGGLVISILTLGSSPALVAQAPDPSTRPSAEAAVPLGAVRSYLLAQQPDRALAAERAMEKTAAPGADFSPALLAIAQYHLGAMNYSAAARLLNEAIDRFPHSPAAGRAYFQLGYAYQQLGREQDMVGACEKAFALSTAAGQQKTSRTASEIAVQAAELLGLHYVKKNQWADGIRWWKVFTPYGQCGNCSASLASEGARNLAYCQLKLGLRDDALHTIEVRVLDDGIRCRPSLAVMLVDMYRERQQLSTLQMKVRKALAPSKDGPRTAQRYLDLLRLADAGDASGLLKAVVSSVDPTNPQVVVPFRGELKPPLDRSLEGGGDMEWAAQRAAALLIGLPNARSFLLAQAAQSTPQAVWACGLLTRLKDPQTPTLLREKLATEKDPVRLNNYLFFLTSLGTDVT